MLSVNRERTRLLRGWRGLGHKGFNQGGQEKTRTRNLGPRDSKQRIADYHFRRKLEAKFIEA